MKKIGMRLLIFFVVSFIQLHGAIIETAHFQDIFHHVTPNTLVILDIDDTILIPTQTLGTDVWFISRLKQHQTNGLSSSEALDKALSEWEAIRHLTTVKIVEQGTEKVIEKLQEMKVVVMGLTTQGLALATRTFNQLKTLNIDLFQTAPSKEDYYFINEHGVLYRQGILFTSGTPKGNALLKLLDLIDYHPQHILFINDKASHLRDVEKAVIAQGIDFLGLRYSYSDERVANFRQDIADIQWKNSTFDHLLSDQEAEALLSVPTIK